MESIFSAWRTPSAASGPVGLEEITAAAARIKNSVPVTPLTHSPVLSEILGREIYFKWDNKLRTGSFKERGACNFLLCLSPQERQAGVCAASAGNHALALSFHAAKFSIPCTIVMPSGAPLIKVEQTQRNGAEVILYGANFDEALNYAKDISQTRGLAFASPFDDSRIISGQGTCGLEIAQQLSDFDAILVPVGGGGLVSGIATAIKALRPSTQIIGVQSAWAKEYQCGQIATSGNLIPAASIADGIAVKKIGKITGPIIEKLVDRLLVVSEPEIANAIISFLEIERSVMEGAGAAALAGLIQGTLPAELKKVVVLACGSNIDMGMLSRLIEREMGSRGRILRLALSVPDRPGSLNTITGIFAGAGANVLLVRHDRSCSNIPGNVDITFTLEIRNAIHRASILQAIKDTGLPCRELSFPLHF